MRQCAWLLLRGTKFALDKLRRQLTHLDIAFNWTRHVTVRCSCPSAFSRGAAHAALALVNEFLASVIENVSSSSSAAHAAPSTDGIIEQFIEKETEKIAMFAKGCAQGPRQLSLTNPISTSSFETPQTNTIHSFAKEHGECILVPDAWPPARWCGCYLGGVRISRPSLRMFWWTLCQSDGREGRIFHVFHVDLLPDVMLSNPHLFVCAVHLMRSFCVSSVFTMT